MSEDNSKARDFMSQIPSTQNKNTKKQEHQKEKPKKQESHQFTYTPTNNSGQGKGSPVLDIVANRFNWGAFGFTWLWGMGNKTPITLIALPANILLIIPLIGPLLYLALCIWFGVKGNEWAWQNKRWESIEAFHKTQKRWATDVIIICIILPIVIGIAFISLYKKLI